jgi:26S proteasome regulatory subunit N1
MFDHLLQYADLPVRRALPLALGLLSISDPQLGVMDTLSKLSHDQDTQVAQSAVLALGLIGAGTNNSRIAGLLRQLSSYYGNDAGTLFVVRIAQGLLHAGKGTIALNPFYNDRLIMNPVGVGGLLVVLHSCLDMENIILGSHHYMLYHFVLAMFPRMLMTFDEELNPLVVDVRVGQAVDTVGQAGKPKTITGFQTHTTPVLLLAGERAELATDKYLAVNKNLEGFIILRKNPEAEEDEDDTPAAAATAVSS